MSFRVSLQDYSNELLAKPLQVSKELRSCCLQWGRNYGILNIGRLLAALKHGSNGRVINSSDGTHVQQHIDGGPLSLTWRRSEKGIGNGCDCCQELLVRFLQRFDELRGGAAHGLT